jgi:hypothetical protein
MAILARSFQTPTDCGHLVAWETLVESSSTDSSTTAVDDYWSKPRTCPECRAPVGFLSDQGTDKDAVNNTAPKSVYFKYGKMVYRLCVAPAVVVACEARQNSNSLHQLLSWWRRPTLWRLGFSTDTNTKDQKSLDSGNNTAQARIQSFLGISHGMKVSENQTTHLRVMWFYMNSNLLHILPLTPFC